MVIMLLIPVKFSTVLLSVKMNGELNTALNMVLFIVIVHSPLLNVMVLGLATISTILLLKLWLIMIPMVMVLLVLKMTLNNLT